MSKYFLVLAAVPVFVYIRHGKSLNYKFQHILNMAVFLSKHTYVFILLYILPQKAKPSFLFLLTIF